MALTQVTSAGLKDGEIVNADLHSAAAIAVSKLSGVLPLAGGVMTGSLRLNDNLELQLGSSGSDLKIYHDGSHSYIKDAGTGNLFLDSDGASVAITSQGATENMGIFAVNGAVSLYYDNVKTFETYTHGITVQGPEGGTGVIQLFADEGDDNADKWHFLANTDGTLLIRNLSDASWDTNIKCVGGGAAELYYDDSRRLATGSGGIVVSGNYYTNDSNKIYLGSDNDLELYHDGSNSYIKDAGTGNLLIDQSTANVLYLRSDDLRLSSYTGTETYIDCNVNGAVEIYYDNSKKLETNSTGISVTGQVNTGTMHLTDGNGIHIGNSNDLKIYHNGTDSLIHNATGDLVIRADSFKVRNGAESEKLLDATADGAVELYHNNVKRFETTATGVTIPNTLTVSDGANLDGDIKFKGSGDGDDFFWDKSANQLTLTDSRKIRFGDSGDLQIYHDAANVIESHNGYSLYLNKGSTENMAIFAPDGACKLFYDNVTRLETVSYGIRVSGHYYTNDNFDVRLGTDSDMKLYHDGSDSYITNATGNTLIQGNTGGNLYLQAHSGDGSIVCNANGSVDLYHDGNKKFETHATGGSFYPSSDASSVKVFGSNNSTIACTLGSTNSDEGFFRAYDGGTMKTWVEARGIAFGGDTADANFLNDYEEGTWTPTVHDGTISVEFAHYRKIGKQVTVWAKVSSFSDRSTNDMVRIKSLPYQPISSTDMLGGAMLGAYCSGSLIHSSYVWSGGQIQFYGTGSGSYEQLRHNELNSSSSAIYFSSTYAVG